MEKENLFSKESYLEYRTRIRKLQEKAPEGAEITSTLPGMEDGIATKKGRVWTPRFEGGYKFTDGLEIVSGLTLEEAITCLK